MDPLDFSWNPQYEPEFKWYDKNLLNSVEAEDESTNKFFRLLALCHTVMPEDRDGRLEYQAQSPDEAALVSAARNFGFVFKSRTPNTITIEVKGEKEVRVKRPQLKWNGKRNINMFSVLPGVRAVEHFRL